MVDAPTGRTDARARIIDVASRLLREQGPGAVTTRGVAEAAGLQAPAIYRLFGDKDGLLEAVAEPVMAGYVWAKSGIADTAWAHDVAPVDDLRAAWTTQIEFGLANPTLFRLLSDPDRVRHSPAARSGRQVLERRVHRIAATGQLRVSERHAVELIQAAGTGVIHILLATSAADRDPELAPGMLDAVLARTLVDAPPRGQDEPATTAVALRALAPRLQALSSAERQLLVEWLDRAITS